MGGLGQPGFPDNGGRQREWRQLETATTSPHWPHIGNAHLSAQVLIGQHLVSRLRSMMVRCRLGGSVAALGYMSTRRPDDVDIDILPQNVHIDLAEAELDQAALYIQGMTGASIKVTDNTTWTHFTILNVVRIQSNKCVKALTMNVKVIRNRLNEVSHEIEILHESTQTLKLQLINETAFTYMHLVKDAGKVEQEKYKEVAGFSRLVANSLSRLIQCYRNKHTDSKDDRDRIRQMLLSKIIAYQQQPTKNLAFRCSKILHYFETSQTDENVKIAAAILGELVAEIQFGTDAVVFANAVFNCYYMTNLMKSVSLFLPQLSEQK